MRTLYCMFNECKLLCTEKFYAWDGNADILIIPFSSINWNMISVVYIINGEFIVLELMLFEMLEEKYSLLILSLSDIISKFQYSI